MRHDILNAELSALIARLIQWVATKWEQHID